MDVERKEGMKKTKSKFGGFFRKQRLKLHLSQCSLAEMSGLKQPEISQVEHGHRKYLSIEKLEKVSKIFNCDIEEMQRLMPTRHVVKPKNKLGKLIQSRMRELGLTLEELAKRMGINLRQAKNLVLGNRNGISYKRANLLSEALGLEVSVFFKFFAHQEKKTTSSFGRSVRICRKKIGMSIIQFANYLGISKQFESQIELGQAPLSTSKSLAKVITKFVDSHANG